MVATSNPLLVFLVVLAVTLPISVVQAQGSNCRTLLSALDLCLSTWGNVPLESHCDCFVSFESAGGVECLTNGDLDGLQSHFVADNCTTFSYPDSVYFNVDTIDPFAEDDRCDNLKNVLATCLGTFQVDDLETHCQCFFDFELADGVSCLSKQELWTEQSHFVGEECAQFSPSNSTVYFAADVEDPQASCGTAPRNLVECLNNFGTTSLEEHCECFITFDQANGVPCLTALQLRLYEHHFINDTCHTLTLSSTVGEYFSPQTIDPFGTDCAGEVKALYGCLDGFEDQTLAEHCQCFIDFELTGGLQCLSDSEVREKLHHFVADGCPSEVSTDTLYFNQFTLDPYTLDIPCDVLVDDLDDCLVHDDLGHVAHCECYFVFEVSGGVECLSDSELYQRQIIFLFAGCTSYQYGDTQYFSPNPFSIPATPVPHSEGGFSLVFILVLLAVLFVLVFAFVFIFFILPLIRIRARGAGVERVGGGPENGAVPAGENVGASEPISSEEMSRVHLEESS